MPWKPANGRHAIERASFSLLFREGLSAHAHELIASPLATAAADIGLNQVMFLPPPIQVNFMAGPNPMPFPQQISGPPPGRSFRRSKAATVVEELTLTADALVYSTGEYDRWAGFLARVADLVPKALTQISHTTGIAELRLEYWDRFDRSPAGGPDDPLVNSDTRLIGPMLKDGVGSWHTHAGFFTELLDDRRTLVNANIDSIVSVPKSPHPFPAGVTGQARIYTMASVQATVPQNPLGQWAESQRELNRIHLLLKGVLADIIHPDIAKAINLGAEPAVLT